MTVTRDEAARLIESHLSLVGKVVASTAANYPSHADRSELAQAGALGLVECAYRYEPERGVPFERWAALRIRGAIVDSLRAADFAPRSLRAVSRDVEAHRDGLLADLGRLPTQAELAESMGMSVRELCNVQDGVHRALVLSLDAPSGEDEGATVTLADNIADVFDTDPLDSLTQRETTVFLHDAIAALPERLRAVVVAYFLDGRNSAEIAAELSVTESRVSQMRSEAVVLLRAAMAHHISGRDEVPGSGREATFVAAVQASRPARARFTLPAQRGPID